MTLRCFKFCWLFCHYWCFSGCILTSHILGSRSFYEWFIFPPQQIPYTTLCLRHLQRGNLLDCYGNPRGFFYIWFIFLLLWTIINIWHMNHPYISLLLWNCLRLSYGWFTLPLQRRNVNRCHWLYTPAPCCCRAFLGFFMRPISMTPDDVNPLLRCKDS